MERHSTRRTWMAAAGLVTALALGAGGATLVSAQTTVTPGPPSMFSSTTPVRILDTRTGVGTGGTRARIGPGQKLTVDLSTLLPGFDPLTVNAVVVNVGVEAPSERSYVSLLPAGTPPGATSSLNFDTGQTTANQAIVGVVGGKFDVFNAVGTTEVFIDLLGAYGDATPG
jgi:hypothetical protein